MEPKMAMNEAAWCWLGPDVLGLGLLAFSACGCQASATEPDVTAPVSAIEDDSSMDEGDELDAECGSIPSAFPYESHYVEVLGSSMHYVEEGQGDPILFLHGNPTSSYLWRNVMPHVSSRGRAIAVDLIGMGRSEAPDVDYRFETHARYLEELVDALDLHDVTLVVHDWGSALGFDYAARHPERIKAIAFMEAMVEPVWPAQWDTLPPPIHDFFQWIRNDPSAESAILDDNAFLEQILPQFALCGLSPEAHDAYREPYPDRASRLPVWVWPNEVAIDGTPPDVVQRIDAYNEWARTSELPKLLLWASPGALIGEAEAQWLEDHWENTTAVHVGSGLHFIQESNPTNIGEALAEWYDEIEGE